MSDFSQLFIDFMSVFWLPVGVIIAIIVQRKKAYNYYNNEILSINARNVFTQSTINYWKKQQKTVDMFNKYPNEKYYFTEIKDTTGLGYMAGLEGLNPNLDGVGFLIMSTKKNAKEIRFYDDTHDFILRLDEKYFFKHEFEQMNRIEDYNNIVNKDNYNKAYGAYHVQNIFILAKWLEGSNQRKVPWDKFCNEYERVHFNPSKSHLSSKYHYIPKKVING